MTKTMTLLLFLLCSTALLAAPLQILVSIPPQQEAVRAIAGKDVTVVPIVPPGASPETYSPTIRQLLSYSNATVLFTIGAPMEKALLPSLKKNLPKLTAIDASAGMKLLDMDEQHGAHKENKDHEHHKVHDHDPHVWLSIQNMLIHADNVASALTKLQPQSKALFEQRLTDYKASLLKLQEELNRKLMPLKGQCVVVFHPAYAYLLHDFNIRQISVEHHGKETGPKHLAELKQQTKNLSRRILLTPPQSNPKAAAAAADILELHPRTADPIPENYSEGLRKLVAAIAGD